MCKIGNPDFEVSFNLSLSRADLSKSESKPVRLNNLNSQSQIKMCKSQVRYFQWNSEKYLKEILPFFNSSRYQPNLEMSIYQSNLDKSVTEQLTDVILLRYDSMIGWAFEKEKKFLCINIYRALQACKRLILFGILQIFLCISKIYAEFLIIQTCPETFVASINFAFESNSVLVCTSSVVGNYQ